VLATTVAVYARVFRTSRVALQTTLNKAMWTRQQQQLQGSDGRLRVQAISADGSRQQVHCALQ
jgi:ribosomal protein L31E